jgi:hypothetical protein
MAPAISLAVRWFFSRMHEYHEIKEAVSKVLGDAGFVEEHEELHPDVFGSMFSTFARASEQYRIVWDGKEGCGRVDRNREGNWIELNPTVPESTEAEFHENLGHLLKALSLELNE